MRFKRQCSESKRLKGKLLTGEKKGNNPEKFQGERKEKDL